MYSNCRIGFHIRLKSLQNVLQVCERMAEVSITDSAGQFTSEADCQLHALFLTRCHDCAECPVKQTAFITKSKNSPAGESLPAAAWRRRNWSTASFRKRRWPPEVRVLGSVPSSAHRLIVVELTPGIFVTSLVLIHLFMANWIAPVSSHTGRA